MKPKKKTLNFLIDALAFVAFVFLTTTGVLMYYILPPGSGKHSQIWGMDRHQWGDFHFWIAVSFFAILALHIILHWKWIISYIKGKKQEGPNMRIGLGFLGVLVLILISIAPLISPVEVSERESDNHNYPAQKIEFEIRGYLTLEELEKETGVPVDYVLRALKIPTNTSRDKKLSQLKSLYGFEMSRVREIIEEYPLDKK